MSLNPSVGSPIPHPAPAHIRGFWGAVVYKQQTKSDHTSSSLYQTLDNRSKAPSLCMSCHLAITSFALCPLSIECSPHWVLDQRHARLSVTGSTTRTYASSIDPSLEFGHSIRPPTSIWIHQEMTL